MNNLDRNINKFNFIRNKKESYSGIFLTNSAKSRMLNLIQDNPDCIGLRLSLKKSGCAGFTYTLEKVIKKTNFDDEIYEYKGIKIFVSSKEIPFIDGIILDYVKKGLNYSFKFKNPKASYYCGCGESFGLKNN